MRLLVISDIHGHVQKLHSLLAKSGKVDLILIAGDITHFGGYTEAAKVLEPLLTAAIPFFAVAGNCDADGVEDFLADNKVNLHNTKTYCCDLTLLGASGSLACPSRTPNEYGDHFFKTTLEQALQQNPVSDSPKMIVVTHQPAYGTKLDMAGPGFHTGSPAIRAFIENHNPVLAVSGHIHEAAGIDKIGNTRMLNPGPLRDGRYAMVENTNSDWIISLEKLA